MAVTATIVWRGLLHFYLAVSLSVACGKVTFAAKAINENEAHRRP